MVEIKPLAPFTADDYLRIMGGYTSDAHYRVTRSGTPDHLTISLELVPFDQPYHRRWSLDDGLGLEHYLELLGEGLSLGAYDGDGLVGLSIAERHDWNRTLWIWEFGVDAGCWRQGIGRRLMAGTAALGQRHGFRCLLAETQTTNVNAIRFYRAVGFEVEAVDLCYYSNHDAPDGEVALFMKRKLE